MKKSLLFAATALVLSSAVASADETYLTAEQLQAVTGTQRIAIKSTAGSAYNMYYTGTSSMSAADPYAANMVYEWIYDEESEEDAPRFYIKKAFTDENAYLQTSNITTFGAKDSAATFYVVTPASTGSGETAYNSSDSYYSGDNENFVRFVLDGGSKWFNFNGNQYNAGIGIWTVQLAVDMTGYYMCTLNITKDGATSTKEIVAKAGEEIVPTSYAGYTAEYTTTIKDETDTQTMDVVYTAVDVEDYYSSSKESPVIVRVQTQRGTGSNYYWTYYPTGENMYKVKPELIDKTDIYQLWVLMESEDGSTVIYPYADPENPIGYDDSSNGAGKIHNNEPADYEFVLCESGNSSHLYEFKTTELDNILSNWGGASFFLGFYSTSDAGSRINFEFAKDFEAKSYEYRTLLSAINRASVYSELEGSLLIGEYSVASVNALKEVVADATELLAAEDATDEQYTTAKAEIANAIAALAKNEIIGGDFYRIKGKTSGNYIDALSSYENNGKNCIGQNTADECSVTGTIFYLDESNGLLSYGTQTYLNGYTVAAVGEEIEYKVWAFAPSTTTDGCYNIQNIGYGYYLHDNGDFVDPCEEICGPDDDFVIEKIAALPVYIGEATEFTFSSPVELVCDENLTLYTLSVNGDFAELVKTPATGNIKANTPYYIEVSEDFEGEYCYLQLAGATEKTAEESEVVNSLSSTLEAQKKTETYNCYILGEVESESAFIAPETDAVIPGFSAILLTEDTTHTSYTIVDKGTEPDNGEGEGGDNGEGEDGDNGEEGEGGNGEEGEDQDGITEVTATSTGVTIYDLQGRRVTNAANGIFIINGTKTLVK